MGILLPTKLLMLEHKDYNKKVFLCDNRRRATRGVACQLTVLSGDGLPLVLSEGCPLSSLLEGYPCSVLGRGGGINLP